MGEETFRRYVGMLREKGWWLFVVRLVPFVPDDAVAAPKREKADKRETVVAQVACDVSRCYRRRKESL